MDNAVVVGVGNIYANETLFLCGLHPMKLAENLTRNQCALLIETIKNVLAKAITQGGTTLKRFLTTRWSSWLFCTGIVGLWKQRQTLSKMWH